MLRRFMVERETSEIGCMSPTEIGAVARRLNGALAKLSEIQWICSFVACDRTFCIYLADSETVIREHAKLSGFPANRIVEVPTIFDPTTERQCALSTVARRSTA